MMAHLLGDLGEIFAGLEPSLRFLHLAHVGKLNETNFDRLAIFKAEVLLDHLVGDLPLCLRLRGFPQIRVQFDDDVILLSCKVLVVEVLLQKLIAVLADLSAELFGLIRLLF